MRRSGWLKTFLDKNGWGMAGYMLIAATFWIFILIILPQLVMVDFSFRYNLPPPSRAAPRMSTPSPTTPISSSVIPAIPTATTGLTCRCSAAPCSPPPA